MPSFRTKFLKIQNWPNSTGTFFSSTAWNYTKLGREMRDTCGHVTRRLQKSKSLSGSNQRIKIPKMVTPKANYYQKRRALWCLCKSISQIFSHTFLWGSGLTFSEVAMIKKNRYLKSNRKITRSLVWLFSRNDLIFRG